MKTQKRGHSERKNINKNPEASLRQQLAGIIILEKFKDKIILRNLLSILLVIFILSLIAAPSLILIYNSNPLSEAIFFNSTENSNATGVRLSAPVLFMDFNQDLETSSGSNNINYVQDNSLYNNHGVDGGGYGLQFDGIDDFVNTSDINSLENITALTVSAWVKTNSTANAWKFIAGKEKASGTNTDGWSLRLSTTNQVFFSIRNSTNATYDAAFYRTVTGTSILELNAWYYVAGVYNSSNVLVYVNGVLEAVANCTGRINPITGEVLIGRSGYNATFGAFSGAIEEIQLWNKSLSSNELLEIYNSGRGKYLANKNFSSSGVGMFEGLVANWHLDEGTGTNAVDTVRGLNNGTLGNTTASTRPTWVSGLTVARATWNSSGGYDGSGAYMFDGVGDYINIADSNSLDIVDSVSISFWFKANSLATSKDFVCKRGTGSQINYCIRTYQNAADELEFFYYDGIDVAIGSTTGFDAIANQWYHVTLSNIYGANNTLQFYKDGLPITTSWYYRSGTGKPSADTNSVIIGSRAGTSEFFNGTIDQVQIFNRALSSAEVLCLYNGTGNCGGKNNSNYIGKYSSQGDYRSLVFYNSTIGYWNTSLTLADTYSTRTGVVTNKNEINLSHPNLVSYWKLDGNYLDTKGPNNGTPVGTNNATGISSGAIRFDGVDDYVSVNDSSYLDSYNGSLTLSFWLKPADLGTNKAYLVKWTYNTAGSWGIQSGYSNGDEIGFFIASSLTDSGVNKGETTNANLVLDNWYHVVFVYDGIQPTNQTRAKIYLNNELKNISFSGSIPNQLQNSNASLNIGMFGGTLTRFFNGSIDEVLIYNTSLTATEVQQLYKSGLSQHADANITLQTRVASNYNITDRNLVGLWGLNGNGNDELGKNNCTISAILNLNGTVGQAYSFDGNDDSVNCTDASFYNGISNISYSFWVKRNNQGTVITRGSPHNDAGVIIYTGGATIRFYANSAGGGSNYGQFDIGIGNITNFTWTHVAISVNLGNENGTFWINGVNFSGAKSEFGTGLPSSIGDTSDLTFFGNRPNLADDYNGSIDEIRIYNRTLTQAEVLDLYNLGASHINWSNNGNWSSEQTCYDDKTQILTENGWKLFSELDKTEKVATLNPKTNKIEYNLPSEYQIYDSPEFMYKIQTSSGELVVSPEHKLYSKTESKKILGVIIGVLLIIFGIFILILKLRRKRKK